MKLIVWEIAAPTEPLFLAVASLLPFAAARLGAARAALRFEQTLI